MTCQGTPVGFRCSVRALKYPKTTHKKTSLLSCGLVQKQKINREKEGFSKKNLM